MKHTNTLEKKEEKKRAQPNTHIGDVEISTCGHSSQVLFFVVFLFSFFHRQL